MSDKIFNKILVIGLGLIGGSFAKACFKNKLCEEIYACDLDIESIEEAKKLNIVKNLTLLEEDLADFELIILATPLRFYNEIIKKISNKISQKAIIIDLGSIKNLEIKNKILPLNLRKNFIPCHPIAGSEKVGFLNSDANLFFEKKFIICPENCDLVALEKVENLLIRIGGKIEKLDAKKHDEIYALVSHLPQFLSFLTVEFSAKKITDNFFQKTFRLNNSDPEIWQDIFKLNEKNLEKFYLKFFENLERNIFSCTKANFLQNKKHLIDFLEISDENFDINFFEENFVAIFFRFLVVISYLEIKEIKEYQKYSGSGFKDFSSIIAILNFDNIKINDLIVQNHQKITKIFNSIS